MSDLRKKIFASLIAVLIVLSNSAAFSVETVESWEADYKSEPYIRLLKEVVVKINKDYSFTETTHIIDKIQNEGGKNQGEIEIDYDQSREEIKDIEAYTILSDGKKISYEKIQDINAPSNYGVYTDNRVKTITMPSVLIGSTIDWKYTKIAKKPVIENHFYDSFRFTCYCPIKEARYKIIAPKDMKLNFKNLNIEIEPKMENSGNETIYTWETRNNDTDKDEEAMPSPEERYKRVTVTTLRDWKELSGWVWAQYKKNFKITPEIKKKVKEITADKKTTADKIQAIIEYLQTDFRYVSMNIDYHNYEPHPTDEIFTNKYGDCKDQTLLAISMLSEIGVKAWPTLVSTHSQLNRTDILPMPSYFDHAIVSFELEDKRFFADVLYKGYRFQDTPAMYSAKRAFVVNDKGGYFAEMPRADKLDTANVGYENVLIRDDGTSVIDINAVLSRSFSVMLREGFKSRSVEDKEKFFAAFETNIAKGGKVTQRDWKNIDAPHTQVLLALQFEHPNWVQKMGDMMMFGMPQIPRGSSFSSPTRRHPIVFLSESATESNVSYTIPAGYEILNLPQKVLIETPFATYTREYVADGNKITGKEIFSYKQARLPVAEYKTVQNFFDELPRVTNDKIVIKKRK